LRAALAEQVAAVESRSPSKSRIYLDYSTYTIAIVRLLPASSRSIEQDRGKIEEIDEFSRSFDPRIKKFIERLDKKLIRREKFRKKSIKT